MNVLLAMRNQIYSAFISSKIKERFKDEITEIAICRHGNQVLPCYNKLNPELVLIDTKLYNGDSFSAISDMLVINSSLKIIGVTDDRSAETVKALVNAGACGLLHRDLEISETYDLIKRVMELEKENGNYKFILP